MSLPSRKRNSGSRFNRDIARELSKKLESKPFIKKGELTTIHTINQQRPDLTLVIVDSDVQSIKDDIGKKADEYDGFFVKIEEGEFTEIYGFHGNIPHLSSTARRLR